MQAPPGRQPVRLVAQLSINRTNPIAAADLAALNRRIVETFARKQKGFFHLMSAYLVVMTAAMLGMLALYLSTTDLKQCFLLGIGILMAVEGTVLMKPWYWIMHGKLATVREIKLLQLAIAELKTSQPTSPQEEVAGCPDESTPEAAPTLTASASHKWWRIVLIPVWLLAVASLLYSTWFQSPYEPRDVTPYFEKIIAAADGTAEWQQEFEVTRARRRFYPQMVTSGKTARVWISVCAEGREPMFTGPLEPGWKTGFGSVTPGRYFVKGRTERANGDGTGVSGKPPAPDGLHGRPPGGRTRGQRRHGIDLSAVSMPIQANRPVLESGWRRGADVLGNVLAQ